MSDQPTTLTDADIARVRSGLASALVKHAGNQVLIDLGLALATIDSLKYELAQRTKAYYEASEQGIAAVSQMDRYAAERDALRAELALKDKVVVAARKMDAAGWMEDFREARADLNKALNDLDKVMETRNG